MSVMQRLQQAQGEAQRATRAAVEMQEQLAELQSQFTGALQTISWLLKERGGPAVIPTKDLAEMPGKVTFTFDGAEDAFVIGYIDPVKDTTQEQAAPETPA